MNLLRGQILLRRPPLPAPASSPLPEGYILRTFRPGDEEHIARLINASGFSGWSGRKFMKKIAASVLGTDGVLVIEHAGVPVFTCTVLIHPRTGGGELVYTPSWLASDPRHRGMKLGKIIGVECWRRAFELGYPTCEIKTDDWRLPAIAQYLDHNFVPDESSPLHRARWRVIRTLLSHSELRPTTIQFDGWQKLWNKLLFWELFVPVRFGPIDRLRTRLAKEILIRAGSQLNEPRRA